jgi:hypothetical protein
MQVTNRTPKIVVTLCIVLAAAALPMCIVLAAATLIGATVWTPAKNTPMTLPVAKTPSPAPITATFTGEYENGVPVYRLPSIAITATRAEVAAAAQADRVAQK